jgi:predicted GH43/DUF377 family glycosyl hydrolase
LWETELKGEMTMKNAKIWLNIAMGIFILLSVVACGKATPVPTSTPIPSATATATYTPTPTNTSTPTSTPTPTFTPTFTPTPTSTLVGWIDYVEKPVFPSGPAGSWDVNVDSPYIMWDETISMYRMWYTGWTKGPDIESALIPSIGYATSSDGISWNRYEGNPVLTGAEDWEKAGVSSPTVLFDGTIWKMWYSGRQIIATDDLHDRGIGLATSTDGIHWTKYEMNPVMLSSDIEITENNEVTNCTEGISSPSVLFQDGTYQMWFTCTYKIPYYWNGIYLKGRTHSEILRATSKNGIGWFAIDRPVLDNRDMNEWDNLSVLNPSVIFLDGKYHMWYEGLGDNDMFGIGHAVSVLGNVWTRDPSNPILGLMNTWAYGKLNSPLVVYHDGFLRMWFSGEQVANGPSAIGYAEGSAWDLFDTP